MNDYNQIKDDWYSLDEYRGVTLGQTMYIADVAPLQGMYEVTQVHVRNIRSNNEKTYFVAIEENKLARSRVFNPSDIDRYVFRNEKEAQEVVDQEKKDNAGIEVSEEVFYEED